MLLGGMGAGAVRLYKASAFPVAWEVVGTLLDGVYQDASIVRYGERWWMFAGTHGGDTLGLYYADDLMGPWTEHPGSPIVEGDANIARPGGRVLIFRGQLFRYTQDGDPTYGNQVRAFHITRLTTKDYRETELNESPILGASGRGWNGKGMHTIDAHQIGEGEWIACVDGLREALLFGFRY